MVYIDASIYQNSNLKIPLGVQGENLARCVVFDITNLIREYGEGLSRILVQRAEDKIPYEADIVERYDNSVRWSLTNVDTGKAGAGKIQFVYTSTSGDDSVVAKTIIYNTEVLPSLGMAGDAPGPSHDIIEELMRLIATKQNILSAGENITISEEDTISATDTVYTAGAGISIDANGVISLNLSTAESEEF